MSSDFKIGSIARIGPILPDVAQRIVRVEKSGGTGHGRFG
jgi:hypothetical protein